MKHIIHISDLMKAIELAMRDLDRREDLATYNTLQELQGKLRGEIMKRGRTYNFLITNEF